MTQESISKPSRQTLWPGMALACILIAAGAASGYYLFRREERPASKTRAIRSELEGITSVAVGADGTVYAGGSFGVKLFDTGWQLSGGWATPKTVNALAVGRDGTVYVAYENQVEKFSKDGRSLLVWGKGGCDRDDFALLSGIAVSDADVFVADSGARMVYRFTEDGQLLNEIGRRDAGPEGKGLLVPGSCLDCAVWGGVVYVNNPGCWRVEKYDLTGRLLGAWGKGGWKDDEFPGCCNPTNLTVLPGGEIAVAQKGVPRIKVFGQAGKLVAVLGKGVFAPESRGIDLATDSQGRIYAVDRVARCVRVFEEY